jgi:Fibronectin type III domain/Kelch motif/Putative Ig domain/Galactose oxidase, central domain
MKSTSLKTSLLLAVMIALVSCGTNTPVTPPNAANPPGPVTSNSTATPLIWIAGPSLPAGRSQAATVILGDGSVFVLGGSSTTAPTSVLKLAPGASAWTTPGTLDHIRVAPGAGVFGNSLIVFGGADRKVDKSSTLYDPNTNRTSSVPSMTTPRAQHAYAGGFGLIYAIGGRDDLGNVLASVESFGGGRWFAQASLPEARVGAAATSTGLDVYVFGGANAGGTVSNTVYKLSSGAWTTVAPMPVAVQSAAVVLGKNNLIYVLGGSNGTAPVSTVQVYNTVSNTWNLEASLPVATSAANAAIDSTGRIMVIGGVNAANANLASVWTSPQSGVAPIITSAPVTTAVINQAYSYQLAASGKPTPTFSLVTGPTGMTVDTTTGLISWTPTVAQFGPQAVTLRASSLEGSVDQTFSVDVQAPPPSVPTGLVVTDVTETSFTLSWNPSTAVLGSISYVVVQYYSCGSRSGCSRAVVSQVTGTSASITGLTAGGTNGYSVTAVSSAGSTSATSVRIPVTTLQPAAPTNLTVTNTTQVSVSLSWTASVGPVPIVGYRAYDIDAVTGLTTLRVDGITGTSTTVTNLLPNSRHLLRIVAYDAGFNQSPVLAGNQVDVTTNSLPSIFHPPIFPNFQGSPAFPEQVVGIVGESLMVTSSAAHTTAGQNYVLSTAGLPKPTLSVLSGPAGMSVDTATGVVSWNPVSAAPGAYSATIRGTNVEGTTDFSFNYTVYAAGTDLLSPTAPFVNDVTGIASSTALASWIPSTDDHAVTGYDIFTQTPVATKGTAGGPIVKVGTTSSTSFNLTGLTPNTFYAVYIQAFDAAGNTSTLSPRGFVTLP